MAAMSIDLEVEYHLAENLIQNDDFQALRYHSVLRVIQDSYQKDEVIEEILKMREDYTFAEKWDSFEAKIGDSIINNMKHVIFHPLIRSVVNTVGSDIYAMYWKVHNDDDFRLLLKNLVLNWQDGSINLYKTVLKMIDESDLSNEAKFELACKYFLGKDVVRKYGKFLPVSTENCVFCNDPYCNRCVPLKFWRQVYLNEDGGLDSSLSNGEVPPKKFRAEEKHDFVFYFKWALHTVNDIAVQYLWENLTPTVENKRICSAFVHSELLKYGMTNITAYLISKTQGDSTLWDVENTEDGDLIMDNFLRNSRWHKYVIKLIKASEDKIPISFVAQCTGLVSALEDSISKRLDTFMYRSLLKELLQMISADDGTMERFRESKTDVLYPILRVMDFEALEIIMKIYRETDVLSLLDNDVGLRLYVKQMTDCAFQKIENFLKKLLKSDEEMSKFLSRAIDDCFSNICENFIFNNNMDGLDLFSKWCEKFISEELHNKKMRLPFKTNGTILRYIIFGKVKTFGDPFKYSDKFLLWSFGNQEDVDGFKKRIVKPTPNLKQEKKASFRLHYYDDFRRCVERSEFEFLDKFLNWSGCGDKIIRTLKSQMLRDTRISKHFCEKKNSDGFWAFLRWVDEME